MKNVALLTAAFLGFACGAANAAEKATLVIDWLPGGTKAPAYVAAVRGFFAAEGLEIEIQHGRGTTDAITKVATGSADFATGGLSSLLEAVAQSNVPVKSVMSFYSKPPDSLFVIKGGPIKSLKDVVGRTIGTTTSTSSNTIWPIILSDNGIDQNSVRLLSFDPGAIAPMLATGRVDATVSWITQTVVVQDVLKQAGKELEVIPWSDYGLEGYGWALFASDRVITQRPKVVAGFVRAMLKATEVAVADPAAAGEATNKIAPNVDAKRAAAEFEVGIPLYMNEVTKKDGLGAIEPELLKRTWVWVAKAQKYPLDKIDPEIAVNRSFLPK